MFTAQELVDVAQKINGNCVAIGSWYDRKHSCFCPIGALYVYKYGMNDNTLHDLRNPELVAQKLGVSVNFLCGFLDAIDGLGFIGRHKEYIEGYKLGEEVFKILSDRGFTFHVYD